LLCFPPSHRSSRFASLALRLLALRPWSLTLALRSRS
jgi:hypothetical protein